MLLEIYISNFILIDKLRISFPRGLTVLSGETGAGKSILVDALGLIWGERAQKELVRDSSRAAIAEASFDITGLHQLQALLVERGLLEPDETIVVLSREIVASGKNLARINGRTITASLLRQVSAWLLDMHLQHDHLSILKPHMYLSYLDRCSPEASPLLARVESVYQCLSRCRQELQELHAAEQTKLQRIDFLSYQIKEIETAGLQPGEEEELQHTRQRIRNLDKLINASERSVELLYRQEQGHNAYDLISAALDTIAPLENDPFFKPLIGSLQELCFTLEEMAAALSSYRLSLEEEPCSLDEVEARLHLIQRLKSRYGPDIPSILEYLSQARQELETLQDQTHRQEALEQEINGLQEEYLQAAEQLSQVRKTAALKLEAAVQEQLLELNMPYLRFKVEVLPEKASIRGINRVELLFSPNPGEEMKPILRVASGGEMSRLVLALKIVLAGIYEVPTLVFDEIDAGVGGQSLTAMARKMAELSRHYQVLIITHAPVIASAANQHFLISKEIEGQRTITRVTRLDQEQRVQELARMLSGNNISPVTIEHARHMLSEGKRLLPPE